MGTRPARGRPRQRVLRRRLRRRADGHEAAARVLVDREPRYRVCRRRTRDRLRRRGDAHARRARDDRDALSLRQSRLHEEPAVPRHRRGAALDRRTQSRTARRAAAAHAVDRVDRAGRRARDRRSSAAQRLRVGVAAAAGVSLRERRPGERSSTCCCRLCAAAVALCAALAGYVMVKFFGIVFLGQPREAALGAGARLRPAGADGDAVARGRVRSARAVSGAGRRRAGAGDR